MGCSPVSANREHASRSGSLKGESYLLVSEPKCWRNLAVIIYLEAGGVALGVLSFSVGNDTVV